MSVERDLWKEFREEKVERVHIISNFRIGTADGTGMECVRQLYGMGGRACIIYYCICLSNDDWLHTVQKNVIQLAQTRWISTKHAL